MAQAGSSFDVAVLGAGAAGLIAAFRAAERGRRVVLLEKNRRPGVKILISGGTRCNITNARGLRDPSCISGPVDEQYDRREARGARSIQEAFGAGGPFLGPALKALGVEATVRLFEEEGLATKIEGNGKIFPASDRAVDVLEALLRRLARSGAAVRTECPARGVTRVGDAFVVETATGPIQAGRVILAMGGRSYPGCGTTGDGYAIAAEFGHTIIDPRPALVPLRVTLPWVTELRGVTLHDVRASIDGADGSSLSQRREAVLFAHFGLTGPAILDVSGAVARSDGSESLSLRLDLLPDDRPEVVDRWLQDEARRGRPAVAGLIARRQPRRLAEALLLSQGIPGDRVGPELGRGERRRLVASLKGLVLPVAGTLGFGKAEVTSGGVALAQVDPATLESRRVPGLHFAGEVLDLDGRIGGYNFQAAWSTGWLAGSCV